jgi:hypothetical protein
MAYFLGVDTGGTYTDAVILDEAANLVLGKAKALTSRHDLAVGIGEAVDAAIAAAGVKASDVALVSLSTTLATNALVEGQGARVALVFIGFDAGDLARANLTEALKGDPVVTLAGGHTHAGTEAAALDLAGLERAIRDLGDQVSGFAVASSFATRNPAHEVAARDLIRRVTGRPVTCSHELSANLNGPKRALTAVLERAADRNDRPAGCGLRTASGSGGHRCAFDGGARRWSADFGGHGAGAPDRDDPLWPCRQHRWRALADRGVGCAGQRHRRDDDRCGLAARRSARD